MAESQARASFMDGGSEGGGEGEGEGEEEGEEERERESVSCSGFTFSS